MAFVVVDRNPDRAVGGEQAAEDFEALFHKGEPEGVFHHVVVVLEGRAGIVRRVDVDALDFASVLLFEGFEGEQVVAVYEDIVGVGVAVAVFGFEQEQAGFEAGGVAFAEPGEFEFLRGWHVMVGRAQL